MSYGNWMCNPGYPDPTDYSNEQSDYREPTEEERLAAEQVSRTYKAARLLLENPAKAGMSDEQVSQATGCDKQTVKGIREGIILNFFRDRGLSKLGDVMLAKRAGSTRQAVAKLRQSFELRKRREKMDKLMRLLGIAFAITFSLVGGYVFWRIIAFVFCLKL
jgi:transcriptional regulator with XRE-family HTH domain